MIVDSILVERDGMGLLFSFLRMATLGGNTAITAALSGGERQELLRSAENLAGLLQKVKASEK